MGKCSIGAAVLLFVLAACSSGSSPSAGSPTTTTADNPTGGSASPIVRQQRSLTCGTTIAAPLAASRKSDSVQVVLNSAVVGQHGLTLSYRLTAVDPKTMLTVPIGEIPPTGLLLKDGRIVATRTPPQARNPIGLPATGYPIGQKPYENSLSVDDACPGTTFQQVLEQPAQYQAVVVMSPQNTGMPTDLKTPLVEAFDTPRTAK